MVSGEAEEVMPSTCTYIGRGRQRLSARENYDLPTDIRRIVFLAIALRLLALVVVLNSGLTMNLGFLGATPDYDDVRYQLGAEYYAKESTSFIDINTFSEAYAQYQDWTGYHLQESPMRIFIDGSLWYLLVCGLTKATGSFISVRLLNIILSALTIIYVFEFTIIINNKRVAKFTARLYAYLPYPIFFCCFGYKDQLVCFLTFFLLYVAVRHRYCLKPLRHEALKLILASIVILGLRSGLSVILLCCCLLIVVVKKDVKVKIDARVAIALVIVVACAVLAIVASGILGVIVYKLNWYMTAHNNVEGGTGISLVLIRGFGDIYKLPLAFVYAAISPFSLGNPFDSWADVISAVNICMVPVAVMAVLRIFKPKNDKVVYWTLLAYLSISLVTSINVFRHLYSLLPIYLIWTSEYLDLATNQEKFLAADLSLLGCVALIFYYLR